MLNKLNVALYAAAVMVLPAQMVEAGEMEQAIHSLQQEWALIHYRAEYAEQEQTLESLSERAKSISEKYPEHAEPLVWEGIILSTYAGAKGGLGALGVVDEARKRLQMAERINPDALDGSIYTSLGSLYYQVPGWPIGFGDDEQAEQYLLRALKINPEGIDPNYFYGDFLVEQGRFKEAIQVLKHALQAPDRPSRSVADAGRRHEIQERLVYAEEQLSVNHASSSVSW